MTKQELEMEVRRQQFYASEARQKAYDTSFALNLLLNDCVTPFHTATTSDGIRHDFALGIVRSVPGRDIFQCFSKEDVQADDKQIILWVAAFEEGDFFGLALQEEEFKRLPGKTSEEALELKEVLQEAVKSLSAETTVLEGSEWCVGNRSQNHEGDGMVGGQKECLRRCTESKVCVCVSTLDY